MSSADPRDAIIGMLRERAKQAERIRQGARRVGYTDAQDAFALHSFGYLGDEHGPARGDVEDLVMMFNLLYVTAAMFKRSKRQYHKYEVYKEELEIILRKKEEEKKEEDRKELLLPLFDDWCIDTYLMPIVYLIRGKLTDMMLRSATAFHKGKETEEAGAVLQSLQMPYSDPRKGIPSTMRQSLSIEEVLAKERDEGAS